MNFGKIELIDVTTMLEENGGSPLVAAIVNVGGTHFEIQIDSDGEYTDYTPFLKFLPTELGEREAVDNAYGTDEAQFIADRAALVNHLENELETIEE